MQSSQPPPFCYMWPVILEDRFPLFTISWSKWSLVADGMNTPHYTRLMALTLWNWHKCVWAIMAYFTLPVVALLKCSKLSGVTGFYSSLLQCHLSWELCCTPACALSCVPESWSYILLCVGKLKIHIVCALLWVTNVTVPVTYFRHVTRTVYYTHAQQVWTKYAAIAL
jgi:hypothetical protein